MPCHSPKTNADKIWSYVEYYQGDRDEENRKNGDGLHHWTGTESLEWYRGQMLRDTMHGCGDYYQRYQGATHAAFTYEGQFYKNRRQGYGTMSYPDGQVFKGLYLNNIRWGPGVVSHACLREDVGLWYGYQLVRLAWRPAVPSVAIDLVSNPVGSNVIAPNRILLTTNTETIGEVNSALELLKQYGAEPLAAAEKWPQLYPKSCTDTDSQLFYAEVFDRAYYNNNQINTLTEVTALPEKDISQSSKDSANNRNTSTYYAWNNNKMIIHMMKHCYTHEEQRKRAGINLKEVLAGPRSSFKEAGKHELDCRTLLMACYLGHIANVAQLINEYDVIPNVTDIQGNSCMMYAACGDQPEIIHFLVEAGAEVDAYNDACCTPLGITLLRYVLEKRDIAYSGMLQALLPPPNAPAPPIPDENIKEWNINRNLTPVSTSNGVQRSPSKSYNKPVRGPKTSQRDLSSSNNKKKPDAALKSEIQISKTEIQKHAEHYHQLTSEDKQLYITINNEYLIRVAEEFSVPSGVNPVPYIFEVHDMNKDILVCEEEQKKTPDKNAKKVVSKTIKDTVKATSRDQMWQSSEKEDNVYDSIQQKKQDKLARIMLTILQLLSEGADPRKIRCPQPPLFIAVVSGCADLIRHLVQHGTDINEVYPQAFGYTTLDLAVSGPLTYENLEVIRSLLESGADTNHRLQIPVPLSPNGIVNVTTTEVPVDDGPTLLHALLARSVEVELEEEVRRKMLELLLEYGCNPITQYKGRSAVDMTMSKQMDIFDIFIKSPRTDLNAVIDDTNQCILVKMFYLPYCRTIPLTERLQMLTNLLLFGADPLRKCQNGKEEYKNLFVYAKKTLLELESFHSTPQSPTAGNGKKSKNETNKPNKPDKSKKDADPRLKKTSVKSVGGHAKTKEGKQNEDYLGDYKQALDLVVDCARLLYIRWLQAKLMKVLIDIVHKYKHRPWNMILKEHKNKKSTGLWLTVIRCLEIWDVLKTTKKKIYNDDRIFQKVLCIIHFYYKRTTRILRCPSMTAQEKALIEMEVAKFIHEHKLATKPAPDLVPAIRPYVTPELTVKDIEKFNVCFECAMPLEDANIPCGSCKLIAFCSFDCMKKNIKRINCHPCSNYLKEKYFSTPEEAEALESDTGQV